MDRFVPLFSHAILESSPYLERKHNYWDLDEGPTTPDARF